MGVYPEITLKQARQRREEIRSKIANGVDPSQERKAEKRSLDITFEVVAREWCTSAATTGATGLDEQVQAIPVLELAGLRSRFAVPNDRIVQKHGSLLRLSLRPQTPSKSYPFGVTRSTFELPGK